MLVPWLVGSRGNDGSDPSPPTPLPDSRIAVPLVGSDSPWPTTLAAAAVKQPTSHRGLERFAFMPLSGGEMDGDYETVAVTDQMDLRAKPAPGTSHAWSDGSCICAVFGPPNCGRLLGFFFAPAAARLARMTEPSIHQRSWSIWPWSSSSSSSEVTIRTQVPSARHRLKHLKTVSQGP